MVASLRRRQVSRHVRDADRPGGLLGMAGGDHHARALGVQQLRRRQSDAGAAPGHQHAQIGQAHVHRGLDHMMAP